MKLFKLLTLTAIIAIALTACNCCKKSTCSKKADDGNYNIVMSFWSQSSGPDRVAHKGFNDYLDAIKDKDKKMSIEKFTWGREGEKDYCIQFLCIKNKEKAKIIADLKAIVENSKISKLHENTSCKHKP